MIGKGRRRKAEGGSDGAEVAGGDATRPSFATRLAPPALRRRAARGFTLLELMIVISILVILALIAMAQYNKTVQAAREATLREDLHTMRKMIDQYAADKGRLPRSISELQEAGYIHEIPLDPMTDERDWEEVPGEDPGSTSGDSGMVDVHSRSSDQASDGTRYSEW